MNYESGTVKNVHYGDVLIKFGDYINASETELPYISDDAKADKFKNSFLQDGDIIIADTAEDEAVGKCTEIQGSEGLKLLSGLHTIACRPKEKYGPMFLGYYINSPAYHNQLKPLMQGIKVTSISKSALQDTDMIMPQDIEEQEKIGEYFSNLDHLITLHQRKYFIMYNKLITWEQRKVKDISDFIDGNYGEKYPRDDEFVDSGIPFFTSAVTGSEGIFNEKNVKFISTEKNRELTKAQSQGGDLILTNRGASMGVIAEIPEKYGLVNIGPQLTRIRGKEKEANNKYLLCLFQTSTNNKKLTSMNAGSAMPFIGLKGLGNIDLLIPQYD